MNNVTVTVNMNNAIAINLFENFRAVKGDGHWYAEKLYLTQDGEFVLNCFGEEFTEYKGEKVMKLLTYDQARRWCFNHLPAPQYRVLFEGFSV